MHAGNLLLATLIGLGPALTAQAQPRDLTDALAAGKLRCDQNAAQALPGEYNFCLGQKYWGQGKFEAAANMLELASGWGNKAAQRALGVAYFNGDGLSLDRPLGLAWLTLATERDSPQSLALAGSAWRQSTHDERELAAHLLAGLRDRHIDAVAAQRAEHRFEQTVRRMQSNPVYGRGQCLPGAGLPPGAAADQAADGSGGCSMAADDRYIASLREHYDEYSAGWKQRIDMGTPQQIPRH